MRMFMGLVMATMAIGCTAALGQEQNDRPADGVGQTESGEAPTDRATETQSATDQRGASGAQSGETWRYKRHAGLWWYWLPSNQWVYWSEGRWVNYDAKTYAEFRAARAPQVLQPRSGSSNQSGGWGPWGPIRYDRFGNPQYPYSQRTSGLRQLGPVPTPAGVRSLPGWGGER
ncbi:MAG TPA: hypothetical protein VHV08_12400 [Pirellulales bacterium]|nr:hypothetical protein [Pirellulales bacterium]